MKTNIYISVKNIFLAFFILFYSFSIFGNIAAEELTAGQQRTFVVSAYYSPLPNQDAYVFGNYEAEMYVNGKGIRGADFTKVYLGMLAAPQSYPFGTKIYIPGIGTGTVHDRGGAITAGHTSDRIDVWMGWGDDGRKRAINWGMKTIVGTIQPWNTPDRMEFSIGSYNSQINKANTLIPENINSTPSLTLKYGDSNERVTNLQNFLKSQELFDHGATGYYGPKTEDAVFAFQKKHGIVSSKSDTGAGIFGPKTRKKLEELWGTSPTKTPDTKLLPIKSPTQKPTTITSEQNQQINTDTKTGSIAIYTPKNIQDPIFMLPVIPENSDTILIPGIGYGDENESVLSLQKKLKLLGFFEYIPTGYYGIRTQESVLAYQLQNQVITSHTAPGAGYFGPKTYESIMLN